MQDKAVWRKRQEALRVLDLVPTDIMSVQRKRVFRDGIMGTGPCTEAMEHELCRALERWGERARPKSL